MDTVTVILSSLLSIALLLMVAPSVFRMNRGRILQNTALWMGIFLALALAYKTLGPGAKPPVMTPEISESTPAPAQDDPSLAPRI